MQTPVKWSHLTYLTSTEQSKMAQFEKIGRDLALFTAGQGPEPDLSGITYSQVKQADGAQRALKDLVNWSEDGIKYCRQKHKEQVNASDEAANP